MQNYNLEIGRNLWAVIDPNWGEPFVIVGTVRETAQEAEAAFLKMPEYSLYHGGSEYPWPNGTVGSMSKAQKFGSFRLAKISITEVTA